MAAPSADDSILVAGGGIGGLSAAIAIAREGMRVRVMEREPEFSIEGAGIQLGPNATRILREWGVLERLEPTAVRGEGIGMGTGFTGELIARVPLGDAIEERHGAPYLMVRRADLHKALLETAKSFPAVKFHFKSAVTGFEHFGEEAVARTEKSSRRAKGLVGADGVWSTLRQQICPTAGFKFTDRTAWRASLKPSDLPEELRGPWTGLWMAPNAHLVHYPVDSGKAINLVAVVWERWVKGEGWSQDADPDQLLPYFEKWDIRLRDMVAAATGWRKWLLYDVPPLRRWSFGAVTLLGDAAHPVSPFLAQGGALAIEDAAILARRLAQHKGDPLDCFHLYENDRIERTARVRYEARKMGNIYHMGGVSRRARDFVLSRRSPDALLQRFDWLYGFDALTTPLK